MNGLGMQCRSLDESNVEERYGLPAGQGTLFVSAATTTLCPDFAAG